MLPYCFWLKSAKRLVEGFVCSSFIFTTNYKMSSSSGISTSISRMIPGQKYFIVKGHLCVSFQKRLQRHFYFRVISLTKFQLVTIKYTKWMGYCVEFFFTLALNDFFFFEISKKSRFLDLWKKGWNNWHSKLTC